MKLRQKTGSHQFLIPRDLDFNAGLGDVRANEDESESNRLCAAVKEVFSEGSVVVLLGGAGGTYSPDGELRDENRWSTPAAWRMQADGETVVEWRLYADQEPIHALVRKTSQ